MRKYGILSFIAIVIVALLGIIAAVLEWWAYSLILGFIALVGLASLVLLCIRYIARLMRTQERKASTESRCNSEHLAMRIGEAQQKNENLLLIQQRQIGAIDTNVKAYDEKFAELDSRIHKVARSTADHISQTVRHSTNEIEALLQIFSRFSDLKLPMPSTGGWALDARSLAHLISIFEEKRPQRILELGSGTSTVWLAYLCRLYGGKVVALDHLEEYLDQTRGTLKDHGLDSFVDARLAPLEEVSRDRGSYKWYALGALEDVENIDMVLVDGPPATTGKNARFPALPNVIDRLAPDATVILDDAHRPEEADIVDLWQSQFPEFTRQVLDTPRIAVLNRNAD
ncbi:MAG: class I SAM-dependent methyltransferase [Micrococcaceae bacterium]|nr:class I SAM-dependent methyltransferase [Micrococcaceae bacterium]